MALRRFCSDIIWFNRFCGVERRDFVRAGPRVEVGEADSCSSFVLVLGEVDLGRMGLVLRSVPRVLEVVEALLREEVERVKRALFLVAPDADGFGEVF